MSRYRVERERVVKKRSYVEEKKGLGRREEERIKKRSAKRRDKNELMGRTSPYRCARTTNKEKKKREKK